MYHLLVHIAVLSIQITCIFVQIGSPLSFSRGYNVDVYHQLTSLQTCIVCACVKNVPFIPLLSDWMRAHH